MSKKDVKPGDVVLIPLRGKYGVGKVLYVSKRYRDVILLGIYRKAVSEESMPTSLPDVMPALVYTSQVAVQQRRWVVVGHEPLKENQQGLAKRIVGGEVWLEDEELRPATSEDARSLPRMLVLGAGLVEKRAEQLTEGGL
jgi:hypothetical protein